MQIVLQLHHSIFLVRYSLFVFSFSFFPKQRLGKNVGSYLVFNPGAWVRLLLRLSRMGITNEIILYLLSLIFTMIE